jgi:AcrR family transcriptional regulator
MSVPYQATGRTRQKARTRDALVAATRALLRAGTTPSVEQAADAAGVSRTTAYRYFPTRHALLAATFPQLEASSLLDDDAPADAEGRLAAFVEAMAALILENEAEMRAMLRLSLEPGVDLHEVALRQGRRQGWVADALAPLAGTVAAAELERLVLAVAAAVGIEAFVWLVDVGRLERSEAVATMRWSADALLARALAGAGEGGG